MKKVWGIDTVLCLYNDTNTNEYIVTDIAICMANDGSHIISLELHQGGEHHKEWHPWWMIEDLINSGHMWREGGEKMAKFLRERKV